MSDVSFDEAEAQFDVDWIKLDAKLLNLKVKE